MPAEDDLELLPTEAVAASPLEDVAATPPLEDVEETDRPDTRWKQWLQIDRPLVWNKAAYFMNWFTMACVAPVLTVYLKERGLPPNEIGIIGSLQPFAGALGSPTWSLVSDLLGIHRWIIIGCLTVAVLVRSTLIIAPSFWAMVVVVLISDFIGSGVGPLLDYSTLQKLKGRRTDYGKQRLWGAVSWGISSLVVGFAVQGTADNRLYFMAQVLSMLFTIYPFYRLEFPRRSDSKKPPLLRAVRELVKRPEVVTFFMVMFLMGILMGQITAFLFVFLDDELNAPASLFGICLAMMCITEIPFFFFSGHLIRWLGNDVVLHLGLLTYIIRFVYYSYLQDPWLVLPAEALHGLTYAASWAAGTDYAASIAPLGLEASMQGLLQGVHWGAGNGVGSLIGGFIYSAFGGRVSFRIFACVAGFTHVLLALSQWLKRRKTRESSNIRHNGTHARIEGGQMLVGTSTAGTGASYAQLKFDPDDIIADLDDLDEEMVG